MQEQKCHKSSYLTLVFYVFYISSDHKPYVPADFLFPFNLWDKIYSPLCCLSKRKLKPTDRSGAVLLFTDVCVGYGE